MRRRIVDDVTCPNLSVRIRCALHTTDERDLHDLASDPHWYVRTVVAQRTSDARVVTMLASDPHWYVRRVVESRLGLPDEAPAPARAEKHLTDPSFEKLDDLRDWMRIGLTAVLGSDYLERYGGRP